MELRAAEWVKKASTKLLIEVALNRPADLRGGHRIDFCDIMILHEKITNQWN